MPDFRPCSTCMSRSQAPLCHYTLRLISIRSEEHTSELQSRLHLVCRLLLEKKKSAHAVRLGLNLSEDRLHLGPQQRNAALYGHAAHSDDRAFSGRLFLGVLARLAGFSEGHL